MVTGPRHGYSSDQYYRRVRLLARHGLISPTRGRNYRVILSDTDKRTLQRFREIETSNDLTLEGCITLLELEKVKAKGEVLESQMDYLRAENRALRKALVRYRRWTFKRILERVRSWFWKGD